MTHNKSQGVSMDNNPFVSVIIPLHNAADTIGRTVSSVLEQDYPLEQYEIIIVDDGSTDGSEDSVRRFPVKLIRQSNAGAASARNTGIHNAKGELIIFLDSDCTVNRDWVNLHVREHIKNPEAECIGGAFAIPDVTTCNFFELCDYYSSWYEQNPKCSPSSNYEYLPSTNISFRKLMLEKINGFDATLKTGEDVEICQRIRKEGKQILFRPHIQIYHYGRRNFVDFLKHHYRWGRHASVVRKYGSGLRYNFLFRPNLLWSICLFFPIAFGYSMYITYRWLRFKPFIITVIFPMVLIAKLAYALGVLKSTLDLKTKGDYAIALIFYGSILEKFFSR